MKFQSIEQIFSEKYSLYKKINATFVLASQT